MLNIFGVSLKRQGHRLEFTGVPFKRFELDLIKATGTSTLTSYMFKRSGSNGFITREFFLLELHYLIVKLLRAKQTRTSRRVLVSIKEILETETWVKNTINPTEYKVNENYLKDFKLKPFDSQLQFLRQYTNIVNNYSLRGLLLDGKAGSGKALSVDTKVRTPSGYIRHGDLKVGHVILDKYGLPQTVEGVYPQGVRQLYTVEFEDGRKVESDIEHLWTVFNPTTNLWSVLTLEEIIKYKADGVKLKVPLSNHSLLVEEYPNVVPTLIGIGLSECCASKTEMCYNSINFDEFSKDQKIELLQALFGTHGIVDEDGAIRIKHDDRNVLRRIQKVVWSLGGISYLNAYEKCGLDIEDNPKVDDMSSTYSLVSYFSAQCGYLNGYAPLAKHVKNNTIRILDGLEITSVTKSVKGEAVCISVSSPDSLYVVEDYVVTHNTLLSLMWSRMHYRKNKTIVLAPANVVNKVWIEHLEEQYVDKPTYWSSLSGKPIDPNAEYIVIHYDALTSGVYDNVLKPYFNEAIKRGEQFKLIVDECHNFNDPKSERSKRLVQLADAGLFCAALPGSGTPLKAASKETYVMFSLICGFFDAWAREGFNKVYSRSRDKLNELFAHRLGSSKYTISAIDGMEETPATEVLKVKIPNGKDFTLESIRQQMRNYIIERVKFYQATMPDTLAFYTRMINEYDNSIKGNDKALDRLKMYKRIVNRFRSKGFSSFTDGPDSKFCKEVELDIVSTLSKQDAKQFKNIVSSVKYLDLKIKGEALGNVLGKARQQAGELMIAHAGLPDLINHVEKKTLIFTNYVNNLSAAESFLTKEGFKPATVYGENTSERDSTVKLFEAKEEVNPLITTYKSLKEGYPLVMANQLIMIDSPFRDYEVIQTKARIHRKGQDSQCFFYALDLDTDGEPNIASRTIDILSWSKEQVDELMPEVEGHNLNMVFSEVTGNEMLEMSYEEDTVKVDNSVDILSAFF